MQPWLFKSAAKLHWTDDSSTTLCPKIKRRTKVNVPNNEGISRWSPRSSPPPPPPPLIFTETHHSQPPPNLFATRKWSRARARKSPARTPHSALSILAGGARLYVRIHTAGTVIPDIEMGNRLAEWLVVGRLYRPCAGTTRTMGMGRGGGGSA